MYYYTQWSKITERDLLQKGASSSKVKKNLKIEKVVLNLTLPQNQSGQNPYSVTTKGGSASLRQTKTTGKAELSRPGLEAASASQEQGLIAMSLLAILSGQRPVLTKARKSIATWKVRKNQVLGCKVSLRGKSALDFLDKTIRFQSLSTSSDQRTSGLTSGQTTELGQSVLTSSLQDLGNLSIGIKKLSLYPELEDLRMAQGEARLDHSRGGQGLQSIRSLGLDLSLNFKNNQEVYNLIKATSKFNPGQRLYRGGVDEVTAEQDSLSPSAMKTSVTDGSITQGLASESSRAKTLKAVSNLRQLINLRKLYLTSLGLV